MTWDLHHGDCRTLMADMGEGSVDSIVTDPPYELGFMGRSWDSTGVAYDVDMWRQALRVLKPGGMLVAFGGARTYHRMASAIEDAGFEIRDQIMWIYGSGFPKGGVQDGIGTCLKPAHEPIVLARKPLVGSARANIAAHGTGGLNIDACRIATDEALRAGAGIIPMRHDPLVPRGRTGEASASARYQHVGSTDFAATPDPRGGDVLGRWPANVIHDGSDDVLAWFPETSSGNLNRVAAGMWGRCDGREDIGHVGDTGSAARFFYCAKASKADREEGLGHLDPQPFVQFQTGNGESGQASSLSAGRETQYRNTHPTVKPEAVMRWLVRLVTPVGGLVLDPFAGSGSTGKAAILEGRRFIGCELTAEYVPIARARIAAAVSRAAQEADAVAAAAAPAPQMHLFDEERAA